MFCPRPLGGPDYATIYLSFVKNKLETKKKQKKIIKMNKTMMKKSITINFAYLS